MMLKQHTLQLPDNILHQVILSELLSHRKKKKGKSVKTLKKNHNQTKPKNSKQLQVLEDCVLRIVSCPRYGILFLRKVFFLGAHAVL